MLNTEMLKGLWTKAGRFGRILVLFAWVTVWTACAGTQQAPPEALWQCDPALDAAVASGAWEEALEGHLQLLRHTPGNCLAIYHVGYIWGHLGERVREVEAYEQAIACGYDQDDRLYFNLGMAYGDLDGLGRAVEALETAVRLNSSNADNHFGLALIYKAAGYREDAEKALIQALFVDPNHLEAHLEMVRLCLGQRRWDDARSHLDAVKVVDPENIEARALQHLLESRRAIQYER